MVSYHGTVDVPGAPAPEVVLAALGPKMLQLCGERTAGTVTWLTGPHGLADYVVPTLQSAAEHAGRPSPRVIALVPLLITDDVDAGRRIAAELLDGYSINPAYMRMIERGGWEAPRDAAIIGNESTARKKLARYEQSGATEVAFQILGQRSEHARTRAFVAELCSTVSR